MAKKITAAVCITCENCGLSYVGYDSPGVKRLIKKDNIKYLLNLF